MERQEARYKVAEEAGLVPPAPPPVAIPSLREAHSLAWLAGIVGIAALGRRLARRKPPVDARRAASSRTVPEEVGDDPAADPAEELRRTLAAKRPAPGGRGPPEAAETLDERRARVHAKAREAMDAMNDEEAPPHDARPSRRRTAGSPTPSSPTSSASCPIGSRPFRPTSAGSAGLVFRRRSPAGVTSRAVSTATPSYAWVSSVGAPVRRRPTVPRLLLEVLFLIGVAERRGDRRARRSRHRRRDGRLLGPRGADRVGGIAGRPTGVTRFPPRAPAPPAELRSGRPVVVRPPRRAHAARAGTRLPDGRDEAAARGGRPRSDRRTPARGLVRRLQPVDRHRPGARASPDVGRIRFLRGVHTCSGIL